MLAAGLLAVRQHRFEVGAAVLGSLALAAWGLVVDFRLAAIDIPSGCLEQWRDFGLESEADCVGPMRAWTSILEVEGAWIVMAMAYLPFVVGVLVGVPIVGRELEGRTAQTAWSLHASRSWWLARQVLPILLIVGVAVTLAAVVAATLQDHRESVDYARAFNFLGQTGPLVTVRAFAAFGIGLFVGALLGRISPAIVFSALLIMAILFGVTSARETWLGGLETEPIGVPVEGGYQAARGSVHTAVGWVAPEGTILTRDEARALATEAGVPPPEAGDVQDLPAVAWYEEQGFVEMPLGVAEATAMGWAAYDAALFGLTGVVSLVGTIPIVNRRRPA